MANEVSDLVVGINNFLSFRSLIAKLGSTPPSAFFSSNDGWPNFALVVSISSLVLFDLCWNGNEPSADFLSFALGALKSRWKLIALFLGIFIDEVSYCYDYAFALSSS
mmetsp:Transcript_27683/g.32282  ORF Transcript_27683/g.32282 Transcript_27683/m.32282 type:complete len:108 (-) Transcript_27683:42-365(-)